MKSILTTVMLFFVFLLTASVQLPYAQAGQGSHMWSDKLPYKQIKPAHRAVSFEHVNFAFGEGKVTVDSDWGQVVADPKRLQHVTGKCSNYVNVFLYPQYHPDSSAVGDDPLYWVVRNLYVRGRTEPCCPRGRICKAQFDHPSTNLGFGGVRASFKVLQKYPYRVATYFDLRPESTYADAAIKKLYGVVALASQNPFPYVKDVIEVEDVIEMAKEYPAKTFRVAPVIHNAGGEEPDDYTITTAASSTGLSDSAVSTYERMGPPPPPIPPAPVPTTPDDILDCEEIYQWNWPNLPAGILQCVPMAYANAFQYLEYRYNHLPYVWYISDRHAVGYGSGGVGGIAHPENSIVANLDLLMNREDVMDLDTGRATRECGQMRGIFGYLNQRAERADAKIRHQGRKHTYGEGFSCGGGQVNMGDYTSVREDEGDHKHPTWEWMFEQLKKGRALVMSFGYWRYASELPTPKGDRRGGHMLRVYGARECLGEQWLYTIDDLPQGEARYWDSNFGRWVYPGREGMYAKQWSVDDHKGPDDDPADSGNFKPDGRLNLNGTDWEIEFAVSIQAKPTLQLYPEFGL